MRILRLSLAVITSAALVYVGGWAVGPVPALGSFLDPVRGVWSVAVSARAPGNARITVDGVRDSVVVEYDDRGVPHIFATTPDDAAWALGYVVARDRLFQLELQTRATAGTLTEILGDGALNTDRFQRELGLAWSADREWAAFDAHDPTARLMVAYGAGVNAWIDAMGARQLPFEYHLLGITPQRWLPVHSFYLTRRMGYTLSYSTIELWRDDVVSRVGERATAALFPVHAPIQEPVQPGGRGTYPWFDTSPLPPPHPPSSSSGIGSSVASSFIFGGGEGNELASSSILGEDGDGRGDIGSNNWVVSGARSATGYPILAGDPHLDLSLPSIWYEVHMVVEGQFDVYGVTIPGAPGIIIGFNRDVAWSVTNVGADVLDYFREELDDPARPTRYRLDGAWEPLERRIEVYRDESGAVLAVDSLYHTHRGPIRIVGDVPYSLRWTNLDAFGGNTTSAFDGAGRATSVDAVADAFREYYPSSQNVVMADRSGNIAIRSIGLFPIRSDGSGERSRDGRTRSSDWTGQWSVETYPGAKNPEQGFLASANQEPIDPYDNADYLGVNWPSPWRAMRINRLLREDSSVTPADMQRFQTDPGNERAELFVPLFVDRADGADPRAVSLLRTWDRNYTLDDTVAVFFDQIMDEVEDRVWDELQRDSSSSRRVATPSEQVLWRVLQPPASVWCDDRRSETVETCEHLIAQSVQAAFADLEERLGPPGDAWRWERHRVQNIYHLLRIRSLSALRIPVQGGSGNLNPSSGGGTHGASWRMVVELGPDVRARTIYPGGQSGNPVSDWYDDRIDEWARGELEDVLYPRTIGGLRERRVSRVTLVPGGRR